MKSQLADVWRPTRGINIKDLKPGIFLFQFYHMDDLEWVLNGGPWTFDGGMLVLSKIGNGEDPLGVPLVNLQFWIQLVGVPSGLIMEAAGKQLGDFFGSFIAYDPINNTSIWRDFMRIKISIDVRQPLRRKKKICKRNGMESIVQGRYERLGDFCFICGLVTHTERICAKKMQLSIRDGGRERGAWLRFPARRAAGQERSRFLRDDRDGDWEGTLGDSNVLQQFSGDFGSQLVPTDLHGRVVSYALSNKAGNQGVNSYNKNEFLGVKFKNPIGRTEEELTGLNMEEGNKRRRGPGDRVGMEIEGDTRVLFSEAGLSKLDCSTSSTSVLAKLAVQASHPQ
ncbi:uncharacterized protein LOC141677486 isoform X2 [Apium graveolens]|uniref:uncharacterized protein LOC141677486 isoform X2 n=1 Tax=Apium graveolens TaxID=4045 RepID=UPI003D7AC5EE